MQARLLIFPLTLFCFAGCDSFSHTVTIPKEKVQQVVDAMVPVDLQEAADLPFPASLTEAEVVLEPGSDRIGMRIHFSADPPSPPGPKPPEPPFGLPDGAPQPPPVGERITGILTVSGELSYDGEEAALYFKNPSVDEVEAGGLKKKSEGPLSKAAQKVVARYLDQHAVYTIEHEGTASKAAKAVLRKIEIDNGSIKITLGS